MTLPTGTIDMNQIAVELGITNVGINLNDSRVRALAGVGSGTISMSNLQGKSSYTPMYNYGAVGTNDNVEGTGYNNSTFNAYPYATGPSGGSGGYTYNWVLTAGNAPLASSTLNSKTPQMNYTIGKFGTAYNSTFRCDITDSTGHVVSVNGISVIINNTTPV